MRKTSPELDEAAKRMRRNPTRAEAVLWERLRGNHLGGYRFRRQHAAGRSVLDFYCAEGRLCVEVDGAAHEQQQDRDEARDAWIATHGVRTLRVRNEEILERMEDVLTRIRQALPRTDRPDGRKRPSPR